MDTVWSLFDLWPPYKTPEHRMRERLAAVQHKIWSHWMAHLFSVCTRNADGSYTIPAERAQRWKHQMGTDYYRLSEEERESDRHQADKVLAELK